MSHTNGMPTIDMPRGLFRNSEPTEAEDRLERIRKISNVAQALENLLTQCDDIPEPLYEDLRTAAVEQLHVVRKDLQQAIHTT